MYTIDEEAARRNKEAMSFSSYEKGSATNNYQAQVLKARKIAEKQKERVSERYHDKIDYYLDKYEKKLADNINAGNRIGASVPSVMIAGPANFPTRKKEKQVAALNRNMEEYNKIQGYINKIKSIGMGGISSDDDDVLEQLEEKLAYMERDHTEMKNMNAYWRKHKTLEGYPGISKTLRDKTFTRQPFSQYTLQNSNQNMKRIKDRIQELKTRNEKPWEGWAFDGGLVEMNYQDNRIQIFFDEKPDSDKRTQLKRNGFRWSPSNMAWQRMLNRNGVFAARRINFLEPIDKN